MSLSEKTKKWLLKNAPVSLRGKTVVVTGGNSGVGYKTAETMAYFGADVILACRNPVKASEAQKALAAEYPGSKITVMHLDQADFSSIDAFSAEIAGKKIDVDVFVSNAGVFNQPGKRTKDGFELIMGTNYLGVFRLAEKLLPYLTSLPHEVTWINTVSVVHRAAKIDYGDFYCAKNYSNFRIYARSKLCLAKYSYYKAKKLEGSGLRLVMSHPGTTLTPLAVNGFRPVIRKLAGVFGFIFNSPEKSSLSAAYILSHPVPAGSIVGPNRIFCSFGYPEMNRVTRKVRTGAETLIAFTEKEIGRPAYEEES